MTFYTAHLRPRLLAVLAAAGLVVVPAAASAVDFDVACPTPIEEEAVQLINQERALRSLPALSIDVRLGAAALRHGEDMLGGCFLSHTGSDGSNHSARVTDAGYPSAWHGEVAGVGQRSAEQIVDGWMNSPGHYAIIMKDGARHIGIAHAEAELSCSVRDYGFAARDFWVANVGGHASPAESPQLHCGEAGGEAVAACSDGLDNDGDGMADWGQDIGCQSPDDPSEAHECADGIDNDADGKVDWPTDPECLNVHQWSESDPSCGLGFEVVPVLAPLMVLRRRRRRGAGSARTRRS